MSWVAAIGTAIQAVSPIVARWLGSADRQQAEALLRDAMDEYGNIDPVRLEKLSRSAMAGISTDPTLKDAQYGALAQLKEMADAGGHTLEGDVAQNQALDQVGQKQRAEGAGLLDAFASRGQAGSGAELAANLSGQQQAAQSRNQIGMQTAANAQRRAYDAIMGRGQLAGQMEGREWDRKSQQARAQDHISEYNNGVAQSNWDNDVKARTMRYGAKQDYAKFKTGQANETSDAVMASGNAAGQGLNAYAQNQNRKSKDEEED